ncbi:metallopeptidase [Nocardia sp. 2]|uniref:Metallopeptidase n=1 Tax=Nocardia acididurans TaxID=2802282 RepID=A0ABS1M383_9NOCA|nr:metallopeptidase [Nocardia acididurans]MBL1075118.1 metallopeptidase [Nocardia acididurans]
MRRPATTIRRTGAVCTILALVVLLLAGCTRTVDGRAVSIYDDPFKVAGLPTTSGPNGPRSGVPDNPAQAVNSDGGEVDRLVMNAIEDIESYWQVEYPRNFDGDFVKATKLVSWSAKAPRSQDVKFCDESTYRLVNAAYCRVDHSIGWDRAVLLPAVEETFGKMSMVMVLAHEYGHAIQNIANLVTRKTPTLVKEQQADCFAGSFIRHVAEGKAKHFTINTSDGLNQVLAATVAIRDDNPDDPDSVHGSAFERVTAVQIGFTDGAEGCKAIDIDEIEGRRGKLPQSFQDDANQGESEVGRANLDELAKAMASIMPISKEPEYRYDTAKMNCRNGKDTIPVTYCPATNTIGTDIDALKDRGVSNADEQDGLPVKVTGDFTAYVVFISRYTLAVQRAAGQALTGAKTGLRAACLSGVITAHLSDPNRSAADGNISLSAGDVDEAVSGLLTDGLAASDTDGNTVPSGFARVDAFRAGVLGDQKTCEARYT